MKETGIEVKLFLRDNTTDVILIPTIANVPPLLEDSAGVSAWQDNMVSCQDLAHLSSWSPESQVAT